MKNHIVLLCLMFFASAFAVRAQKSPGTLTLYPRLGVNFSKFAGDKLYTTLENTPSEDDALEAKYKTGLTLGAELQKQLTSNYAVSIGLLYSNMGTSFEDHIDASGELVMESSHFNISMHYAQVPLMLNAYLARGLAVKLGVQANFLIDARSHTVWNKMDRKGNPAAESHQTLESSVRFLFRNFDVSVPLGLSYEYRNFMLDLRYNIGLMRTYKEYFSPKNRGLVLTLGYGLDL
ncbi:MAG: porin family protein [Prevotellaceae bacterium]|nr:PorT family protein [Prevotella sp.]MDD7257806.1 porin family protein [Prevotellaceae bacterium]MDY6131420.1 porin family protein [Prevotella sp.]